MVVGIKFQLFILCCFVRGSMAQIEIDFLSMFSLTKVNNGVRQVAEASAVFAYVHALAASKRLESLPLGEEVEVIPGLVKTYSCPVTFKHTLFDTRSEFSVALDELARLEDELEGFDLVLGPSRSSTCVPVSFVTSTFALPVFSPSCTSPELDDILAHRFFARTVPSDDGTAQAIVNLIQVLPTGIRLPELKEFSDAGAQVYTRVAVLYQEDTYGSNYKDSIFENVPPGVDLEFFFIPYTPGNADSARDGVRNIARRNLNVILGLFFSDDVRVIVEEAIKLEIMTEDQVWIISDGILSAEELAFGLTLGLEEGEPISDEILKAVNNIFLVQAFGQVNDDLVASFQAQAFQPEFGYDLAEINAELDAQQDEGETDIFSEVQEAMAAHAADPVNNELILTDFSLFAYDMILAVREYIELIGCDEFPDNKIDGQDFIDFLPGLKFEGVTGTVSFDAGQSRAVQNSGFKLLNARFDENQQPFDVQVGTFLNNSWDIDDNVIQFNDNGQQAPLLVDPPEEVETNEIPPEIRGTIYAFGGFVALVAAILAFMTMNWAHTQVIQAAQPSFLVLMLFGVLISTAAVFTFPQAQDAGEAVPLKCSLPYFFLSLGLTISYGSLVFKLRKVIHVANQTPDLQTKAGDNQSNSVKFLMLLILADIFIFVITFSVAPLEQDLRVISEDDFNQPTETFEFCSTNDGNGIVYVLYFLFHIAFYAYGLYLVWLVRNLSTDFQEGKWITLSIISQFQLYLLGIPVVIAVGIENPGVRFMVLGLLVLVSNVVLMGLIFGPKFTKVFFGEDKVTWKTKKQASQSDGEDLFEIGEEIEVAEATINFKRSLMNTMKTDDFGAM